MMKNNEKTPSKARLKYEQILADLRNPVKKAVRSQKISNKLGSLFRAILIFGLAFVIIFPIFQQITLAFRHPQDVQNPLVIWIPEKWSILNFKIAFVLLKYEVSLFNNIRVSLVCMVGQICCSVLAGYALSRLKFKGSNIIFILIMMTFIIPPQAVSVSRMLYFANFDILGLVKLFNDGNTISLSGKRIILYIMSFTGQGINSAIFVFLFRQFFRGVPVELEESAEIDGAGVVRTFWSVMLPNARGVMVTVALFSFVWQWNDVYYTELLGISDNFPLLTMQLKNTAEWLPSLMKLYGLDNLVDPEIRGNALFTSLIANTAGFMMCLPLLIGYLFVQKLFVEGIERTGIVG
ncbi:MAG: carbohydrate ABC transporter permease [Bacilli bacterium]|nr:carbohydrate ABC transporter permease [Bacilli bacterium]